MKHTNTNKSTVRTHVVIELGDDNTARDRIARDHIKAVARLAAARSGA